MSSNSVRHNDYLNSLMRSYDNKYQRSVLYNVFDGKWKEAYVIVRNSSNYPIMYFKLLNSMILTFLVSTTQFRCFLRFYI